MKKQLYFMLFTSLFALSGNAQNLDSLYTIWQDETQADSTRSVAYYHYIRKGYVFSSPDSAIILAEALHRFAKLQDYPKAASAAYTLQGEASNLLANYPQALEYCKKSLAINEEIGDLQGSLIARKLIARMAFDHGEYISARKLYNEIIELATSMGDNGIIADAHNRIGISYKRQGNYSKALAHFRKTLDVHQAIGDQVGTANGFNNIGVVYRAQGDYEKALDYFKKCLDIEEQIGGVQPRQDARQHWFASHRRSLQAIPVLLILCRPRIQVAQRQAVTRGGVLVVEYSGELHAQPQTPRGLPRQLRE